MKRRFDNVVKFRRRGRSPWTRPEAYTSKSRPRWFRALENARPFVLLVTLVGLWWVYDDAALFEPPGFMQTAPLKVEGSFTRCGPGRGYYCVIDGDTFKIGDQSVRVVGIDTPEVDAQCGAEALGAERATAALQQWLNRASFRMTARIDEPIDKYGRELRIVKRINPDGSEDRLADYMVGGGYARRYSGGLRSGWC